MSNFAEATVSPHTRSEISASAPQMDVFIAGMGRAGTTLLANLLTMPPEQWILTEPGLTRGDMGEHVRQQAERFGLQITPSEWAAGGPTESAQARFERVIAPRLGGTRWGVKEVNPAGYAALLARYRPRRVLVAVRDIRDCALSLLHKHEQQGQVRMDLMWLHQRLLAAAQAQLDLVHSLPADRVRIVRYEDLVRDEAERGALADWLGWTMAGHPSRCLDLYGRDDEARRHAGRISVDSAWRGLSESRADWLAFADQLATDAAAYQQQFGYTQARPHQEKRGPRMRVIIGRRQREKILSLLRPGTRMLEWGAGGSTVWLAGELPVGATLTSVEHNPTWFREVESRIGHLPQVRLLLREATGPLGANATIEEEDERPLQSFVRAVQGETFDLILVDGNARSACFRAAEQLLAPGGTLLLHDAQRGWYDDAKARFVAHGHIGSCPDYPSPHLWWGGRSEPQASASAVTGELPLIVSFYTRDTPYEAEARRLAATCDRLGLPHHIVGVDGRGSWEANCSLKPDFILKAWQETGRPVMWVDADAVLHGAPDLLRGTGADFAVHRCRGWQFASGTLFFNQTPAARALLERWVARCRRFPRVWDQDNLDLAWEETVSTQALETLWLPESYCRIFDLHEGRSEQPVVVEHLQASRRLKDEVNTSGSAPVAPVTASEALVAARRAARPRCWRLSPADAAINMAEPLGASGMAQLATAFRGRVDAPARVLLLADGQGVLWRQLSEAGFQTHTLTDQLDVLADAAQFAPGQSRLGRPDQTGAADDAYDAALCFGQLDWLPDERLDQALSELHRVVSGPVVLAALKGPDHEQRWTEAPARDADWWRARFEAASFMVTAPHGRPDLDPEDLITLTFVRRTVMARTDDPGALAPSGLSMCVERALRSAFGPHHQVLVWGTAATIDAAELTHLPWRWRTWTTSPWQADGQTAPPAGAAWQRVLVLLDAETTSPQSVQRMIDLLAQRRVEQAVLVVCGDVVQGVAIRHALEAQSFRLGFRKSPGYYQAVDYEALHADAGPVVIALERLPEPARLTYPLQALSEERDLHMDMLREVGERSDAHVIRYQLAASLIRPGDVVLDAACGLGYGSYLLARLTQCAAVLAADGSDYAIRYAELNFRAVEPRLHFQKTWLPQGLANLPAGCVDVVVSFETLEHVEDPQALLAEFDRLLKPGGRIITSVPNDWSDETGKDPNPHHLHVYTLESLRAQFARHFEPQVLHLQTASGCKVRSHGHRWMRQPRALRVVPIDTSMPPDAEWWILSGRKAEAARAVPATAEPSRTTAAPTVSTVSVETAIGGGRVASAGSVVLAVNCTPPASDPQVLAFWRALNLKLAEQGQQLVIASTTALGDSELQVIEIPFLMPEFARRYPSQLPAVLDTAQPTLSDLVQWYDCTATEAAAGLAVATAFFTDLLDTLRPASVMGWQSANPLTRVLRQCARAVDVPFWTGERGWVRNTLMFDLGDNNGLGEAALSVGLAVARERYTPSASVLGLLTSRAREAADLARYTGLARLDGPALRARLGIPPEATVVALLTHGEPSFASYMDSAAGPLHDLSPERLQLRVDAVADELLARGCWLLVQEHPFNRGTGHALALRDSPRVVAVEENISSVIDAADALLFTVATAQFDAAFLDKPLGLLSRSALYRDGLPPMIGDFARTADFVDAALDARAWPARRDRLCRDIAFLYEHTLLDILPEHVEGSAGRWARQLSRLVRPMDDGFDARVDGFLVRWRPVLDEAAPESPAPDPAPAVVRHVESAVELDPLGRLEQVLLHMPTTRSIDPDELERFHHGCHALGLAEVVQIDNARLRADARTQPIAAALVVVELLLALEQFALAKELAELLYGRAPMDKRVQHALARARQHGEPGPA